MITNEQIIEDLLTEFKEHRDAVMSMVNDIEVLKAKIDRLLPDELNARYIRFFEEKVKTVTEFFKTLLQMRIEIQKSLKDEIDIRRKINVVDKDQDIEDLIDIRQLADKVDTFAKKRNKMKKKSVEEAQASTDEIVVDVKRINAM